MVLDPIIDLTEANFWILQGVIVVDEQDPVRSCSHDYHKDEGPVTWSRFLFKGCWNCRYFTKNDDFSPLTTKEAAEELDVTPATIRKKIHDGKLEAEKSKAVGAYGHGAGGIDIEKFYITKESFEEFKQDYQNS